MAILCHDPDREVRDPVEQRRSNDVSVNRIAPSTTTRFDLHNDAKFVVDRINFVCEPLAAVLPKEDGAPDFRGGGLSLLYLVPKSLQTGAELPEDCVT